LETISKYIHQVKSINTLKDYGDVWEFEGIGCTLQTGISGF